MPIVALLADLGLIPEAVAAVCSALATVFALIHAFRAIRTAMAGR